MPQTPQPHKQYTSAESTPLAPPRDPIASLRDSLRGHYEIERELGQGAFATVYLARDLKHERKVAIKVLHVDPNSEMGELRFVREIRMLARLQHPNILPLHDSGHVENLLYYVMPYVSGETLRDRLRAERQLPWDTACSITREVADALAYAHAQGIIHRDIKPENILLSAGHPMLADFGIARAIDVSGVKHLTRSGMGSPGTPAYMSPEQLLGIGEIDARSDVYSLGCVLYEMLTGTLPFPGDEGLVNRFTEAAPVPTSMRSELPRWIDRVVDNALARAPADRFQTAQDFADALTNPDHAKPTRWSGGIRHESKVNQSLKTDRPLPVAASIRAARFTLSEAIRSHRRVAAVGTAVALLAALRFAAVRFQPIGDLFAPPLSAERVAMIPLAGDATATDRDRISSAISSALGNWRGFRVVSPPILPSQTDKSGAALSVQSAAALARKVGAARFVWGEVKRANPLQVRLQFFDAAADTILGAVSVDEIADSASLLTALSKLLAGSDRPSSAAGGDGRTTSYPALLAYERGHTKLWEGDLERAAREFRTATEADPAFAPARVWLAQALAWLPPESRADWLDQLSRGAVSPTRLSEHDRALASALSNLADRNYPEACAGYYQLARADSTDFAAFYGLGQCLATDSLVIPAAGQSGWSFRSKYSDAARAFMRALTINPNAHAILSFEQLIELLPIAPTRTRRGHSADGREFAAYPSLIDDTVVFTPYPVAEFASIPADRTAASRAAAIRANLEVLLQFTLEWARRSPRSPQAYLALADVREARGEISRGRYGEMSALDAVRVARSVSIARSDKVLAASREAWLTLKTGEFAKARSIADSLLAAPFVASDAWNLIGLAALTGKIGKTAEYARITNDYAAGVANVPVPVIDAAAPFFAFAALGVCGDTLRTLERRVDDQLERFVADVQVKQIQRVVEARPLAMMAPCTNAQASLKIDAGASRTMKLQQAFANHDTRSLQGLLAALQRDARTQRPGDISMDIVYLTAWLKNAMGDQAGAARDLDRALGALTSFSAASLRDAAAAASVARAMSLRAEIANVRGEDDARKTWGSAVAELWATADSPLQPVVAKMRGLATPPASR
ncbi:MAG TPA: serine/threonine-protein kinase [Gemmatimonadaceae bacterium]|nr:serine/threonine-protein kinase [Gemmatimonadaceae bacterium]